MRRFRWGFRPHRRIVNTIALARVGRGERSEALRAEIDRLIAAGESMDQVAWLAALRTARERMAGAG